MQKKLKVLLIFLAILLIAILHANNVKATDEVASGKCGDNITWSLNNKGTLKISGSGYMYGYRDTSTNVTESPWAKYQSQVKEIVFDGDIKSIGDRAFEYNTNITNIVLPDSIRTIGVRAFAECTNLQSIKISDNIARIWEVAFYKCTSLKNVTLKSNVMYLYKYAFAECTSLESITFDCEHVWIEDDETVISQNTMMIGYKYTGVDNYARYYGRIFKNIKTGEVVKVKITPKSFLECLPTKNVQAIGITSIEGYSLSADNDDITYDTAFCNEKQTENDTYKAIKAKVDEIIKDCTTDEQKAKAITTWVIQNMNYQYFYMTPAKIESIYNAFNNLTGSCETYAMLENYMLYLSGIPTATVTDLSHEWTAAYIDGKWVYIDSTGGIYGTNRKPLRIVYAYSGKIYVIDDPTIKPKVVTDIKEVPFVDVKTTDWFYKAVKDMYTNKYMSGTTSTTFSPNEKITRGMIVTVLHNMEKSPYISDASKFSDVQNPKDYYYMAVKWAAKNKIVSGYSNGKFAPNDPITREQLAVILNQYCNYKGKYKATYADFSKFKDSSKISSYAKWGMNWAVGNKIINGSNGKLNPQGTATRAEAAAMLSNYCKSIK